MLNMLGFHHNVNQLRGWGETGDYSYIFLDMCYGGTLEDLVNQRKEGLTEHQAASFMMTLLKTTGYIHGKGWCICVQQATNCTAVILAKQEISHAVWHCRCSA